MVFTPIEPTDTQTDRQDLCDALAAMVDAFIVANTWQVGRKFLSELPDSFLGEGPLIVIGAITERVTHDIQTRTTVFSGSLFFFDSFTSHEEYRVRVNTFADMMRDWFTANVRLVNPAAGELRQVGFMEDERTQGRFTFGAPHVDFEYEIQEGRSTPWPL